MTKPILNTEMGPDFDQSNVGVMMVNADGTSLVRGGPAGTLGAAGPTIDNVAKTLTFPGVNGGAAQVLDFNAFLNEIFVDSASLNVATNVLTLTDNSPDTPDVTVDLSQYAGVSANIANLLTVDGTDGKPLFTKAALDAQTSILESWGGTQLGRLVTL